MAYEDLTAYTEVDPNSRISVTASRSTVTSLTRNEDAWVYDNKGAAHFDGDFEHLVDVRWNAADVGGQSVLWGLTNNVDDWRYNFDNGRHEIEVDFYRSAANLSLRLREIYGVSSQVYDDYIPSLDTTYYLTVKRDESIGTYGRLYCYIYSDSARSSLLATLSVDLHAKDDFQYIFATQSNNDGNTYRLTAWSENFDLQEVPPGAPRSRAFIVG